MSEMARKNQNNYRRLRFQCNAAVHDKGKNSRACIMCIYDQILLQENCKHIWPVSNNTPASLKVTMKNQFEARPLMGIPIKCQSTLESTHSCLASFICRAKFHTSFSLFSCLDISRCACHVSLALFLQGCGASGRKNKEPELPGCLFFHSGRKCRPNVCVMNLL